MTNLTGTTTAPNIAKELKPYLERKLEKDSIELTEIEKSTYDGLDALPKLEDSTYIKGFVKNAKTNSAMNRLIDKLELAKRVVKLDKIDLNYCKLTIALLENNDNFKVISVVSQNINLLEVDMNTIEVSPTIIIKDSKTAFIFKDIFNWQEIKVSTMLDYSFSINQSDEEILNIALMPTFEYFCNLKERAVKGRYYYYNSLSDTDLVKKEALREADNELKELKTLSVSEYNKSVSDLLSDLKKVCTIKNSTLFD